MKASVDICRRQEAVTKAAGGGKRKTSESRDPDPRPAKRHAVFAVPAANAIAGDFAQDIEGPDIPIFTTLERQTNVWSVTA